MLKYALWVIGGISLGRLTGGGIESAVWAAGAAVCAALFVFSTLLTRRRPGLRVFSLFFAIAATVLAAAGMLRFETERIETVWPGGERVWTLRVKGVNKVADDAVSVDAAVVGAESGLNGKTVRLRLNGEGAKSIAGGQTVAVYGQIQTPGGAGNPGDFDYASYLLIHQVSGTLYVRPGEWKTLRAARVAHLTDRLQRFRQTLTDRYSQYFSVDDAAILSALTLGDKAYLTDDVREVFTDTGTSHILALSGLHLSILFALLNLFVLRHVRHRRWRLVLNLLALLFLWTFVVLAGVPVSLVRAACMFSLMQAGLALQHTRNASLNHLSTAALVILLIDPLSLFDVSFQLSFSAVAGILLFNQYVWCRLPLPEADWSQMQMAKLQEQDGGRLSARLARFLRPRSRLTDFCRNVIVPFCTVSFAAQVGTLPFTLYYFHQFAPYALLANVIVIPAAYVLLGGSMVFLALPFDGVRDVLAQVLGCTLRLMTDGLAEIASWPGACVRLYPATLTLVLLTALVVAATVLSITRRRRRRIRLMLLCTLCALVAIGGELAKSISEEVRPEIVIYRLSRATGVHFITSAERSCLFTTIPPDSVRIRLAHIEKNYFMPHGIKYPRLLTSPTVNTTDFYRDGQLFAFHGKRVYCLDSNVRVTSAKPLPIDILLVSRGCWMTADEALRCFRPRVVVLDNTLPYRRREAWREDCRRLCQPLHDLRTQGAYRLRVQ